MVGSDAWLARSDSKGMDGFQDECLGAIAMNSSADDFTAVVNAIGLEQEPAGTTGNEIVQITDDAVGVKEGAAFVEVRIAGFANDVAEVVDVDGKVVEMAAKVPQ